ncbi:MAG: hypothetical protein AAF581_10180 [Planctomycetota bacterium]
MFDPRLFEVRAQLSWMLHCFLALGVLAVLGAGVLAWGMFHGVWLSHSEATSPDGQLCAESRNLYRWGLLYGWNHFHIRVEPDAEIRCKVLERRWRRTPDTLTLWKREHRYASYNDFDGTARLPTQVRWLSNRTFVIEGGEGGGAVFEVRR